MARDKKRKYKCAACGGVFTKAWSEKEALREKDVNFPNVDMKDMAVVCDDCFKKIMTWRGWPQ